VTYFYQINHWNEIHQRDGRIGFIASVIVHSVLFFIGGIIFVKTAHYNVQSVPQSTTVELVEAVQAPPVAEDILPPKPIEKPVEIKKPVENKKQVIVKIQKAASKVINIKADPDYFKNPPPEYPEFARQMRQEGLVMLSVDVNSAGMPIKVEIKQSSGYRLLDQAAVKAVSHWKFQPGRLGDIPVESRVTVPIRFQLEK
jgi:protein TonB